MPSEFAAPDLRAARVIARMMEIEQEAAEVAAGYLPAPGVEHPSLAEAIGAGQSEDGVAEVMAGAVPRVEALARALDRVSRAVRQSVALQRRVAAGCVGRRLAGDGTAAGGTGRGQAGGAAVRHRFLLDGLVEQGRSTGIPARAVTPDRWLQEGDTVSLAGADFAVLHCPGHTPGSVVFVNAAARFAMVGDVLFRGSVGRTDFAYGDGAALIAAIKTKLLPLGDDMAFLCGHGPGSSIGVERASNPFLR